MYILLYESPMVLVCAGEEKTSGRTGKKICNSIGMGNGTVYCANSNVQISTLYNR